MRIKFAERADYHLSAPQFLAVKAHDGMALNAVMIQPPDFDESKNSPVLVFYVWWAACTSGFECVGGNTALWKPVDGAEGLHYLFAG